MPRIYDAGTAGRFEVPDDATDAEIQEALGVMTSSHSPNITIGPSQISNPPPVTPQLSLPRRVGETIGRYAGYLAGSPLVQDITGNPVVQSSAFRAMPFSNYVRAAQVPIRGVETAARVLAPVPGFVAKTIGKAVEPVMRATEAVSPYLQYENPLAVAYSAPNRIGFPLVQRALGAAAEKAVDVAAPAAFAVRDAARGVAERESNYWRNLSPPPPLSPADSTPVVRPFNGYPKAPAAQGERVPWQVYQTERMGPMIWTGKGWVEPTEFQ